MKVTRNPNIVERLERFLALSAIGIKNAWKHSALPHTYMPAYSSNNQEVITDLKEKLHRRIEFIEYKRSGKETKERRVPTYVPFVLETR